MEGKLFTPNPERSFVRKVTFKVPTESGTTTTATLPVTMRSMPRTEFADMVSQCDDAEIYDRIVSGVDGVGDGSGEKLDLAKAKDVMREESAFVYECVIDYQDAMFGGNLRPKTSPKRRGSG